MGHSWQCIGPHNCFAWFLSAWLALSGPYAFVGFSYTIESLVVPNVSKPPL